MKSETALSYIPSIIFIETTKACEYSCRHCRAESQRRPSPDELSLDEIKNVLEQIKSLGTNPPRVVLTGGDLLLRKDVKEIISHTRKLELPFSLSPAASPLLTDQFVDFLKENETETVSLSIDGVENKTHDWLRRMPGSLDLTIDLLHRLKKHGLKIQVNTTIMRNNIDELPTIANMVKNIGASAWELFFLIKTGRGMELQDVTPEQYMQINNWLTDLASEGMNIRTVESPVMRVIPQIRKIMPDILTGPTYDSLRNNTSKISNKNDSQPSGNILNGNRKHSTFNGTLFIGQNGDVYPSGLFPYPLGSVKSVSLNEMISSHIDILNPKYSNKLEGKCGKCEFTKICGGSRSRAFAYSQDPFGEDPACLYVPPSYNEGKTPCLQ